MAVVGEGSARQPTAFDEHWIKHMIDADGAVFKEIIKSDNFRGYKDRKKRDIPTKDLCIYLDEILGLISFRVHNPLIHQCLWATEFQQLMNCPDFEMLLNRRKVESAFIIDSANYFMVCLDAPRLDTCLTISISVSDPLSTKCGVLSFVQLMTPFDCSIHNKSCNDVIFNRYARFFRPVGYTFNWLSLQDAPVYNRALYATDYNKWYTTSGSSITWIRSTVSEWYEGARSLFLRLLILSDFSYSLSCLLKVLGTLGTICGCPPQDIYYTTTHKDTIYSFNPYCDTGIIGTVSQIRFIY
ncbi:hypothetical protein BDQ17DRAFT_1326875 [Cyathus striatus]|nr:hypothetical protein BDQ17DRAFT_1326875 [Cyathus striatus]